MGQVADLLSDGVLVFSRPRKVFTCGTHIVKKFVMRPLISRKCFDILMARFRSGDGNRIPLRLCVLHNSNEFLQKVLKSIKSVDIESERVYIMSRSLRY